MVSSGKKYTLCWLNNAAKKTSNSNMSINVLHEYLGNDEEAWLKAVYYGYRLSSIVCGDFKQTHVERAKTRKNLKRNM